MKMAWWCLAAFLGVALGLYLSAVRETKPDPPPPSNIIGGLVVEAADLDLGEIWEEKAFSWELPIRNRTTSPVKVEKFALSCRCVTVEPQSITIPGGQTGKIRVKLDLTFRNAGELGQARRPIAWDVEPFLGARTERRRQTAWNLQGILRSRVTLDTTQLHFGETAVQGQPAMSRKVIATVQIPFERIEATCDPKVAAVQVSRVENTPDRFEITVSPQPTLKPGPFASELVVSVIAPDGKRFYGSSLPVEGEMQPEVRLLPARLLLPSKKVGETTTGAVVLQAPPDTPIEVKQIDTDSPDVRVEGIQVEGVTQGRAYGVTQRVTREGDLTTVVRFTIRRPGRSDLTLPMEVVTRGEGNPTAPAGLEKGSR